MSSAKDAGVEGTAHPTETTPLVRPCTASLQKTGRPSTIRGMGSMVLAARKLTRQASRLQNSEQNMKPKPRREENDDLKTGREWWHSMLRPKSFRCRARAYRYVIGLFIIADIVAYIAQTDASVYHLYESYFRLLEAVSSCVFLCEYCMRFWTIPEKMCYRAHGYSDTGARCAFIITIESCIDLIATIPWFIEMGIATELPNFSVLRTLRIFRLFKSAPVIGAFDVLARVLYYNAEILLVACLLCLLLLLCTSSFLFYCRPADNKDFSSIPATMYLAVMMLTGQGQPEGALPWYTKLIVIITALFSVAQFAIPASMLTWGFEAEAQRRVKQKFKQRAKEVERIKKGLPEPVSSDSTYRDPDSTDQEWMEYEEVIAGSDGEGSAAGNVDKDDIEAQAALVALNKIEMSNATRIFDRFMLIADRDAPEDDVEEDHEDRIRTEDLIGPKQASEAEADGTLALLGGGDGWTTRTEYIGWLCRVKVANRTREGRKVFKTLMAGLKEKSVKLTLAEGTIAAPAEDLTTAKQLSSIVSHLERLTARIDVLTDETARLKRGDGGK